MTDITNPAEGIAAWDAASASGHMFIMFFTGTTDENGNSWCSDCVDTKHITQPLLEGHSLNVIKCLVTRDEWMGKPD